VKISILIPTFERDHLLEWGLWSLSKQDILCNLEILVINDGTPGRAEAICKKYSVPYLFIGQRNLEKVQWRSAIVALNHGVHQLTGDIIILSAAEMFYLDLNCISLLIEPVLDYDKIMAIPEGRDDTGEFLKSLKYTMPRIDIEQWKKMNHLNTKLPFLMAMRKKDWEDVGGYDLNMIGGRAHDDDDFVNRMLMNGCEHFQTRARTIHLFHDRAQKSKVKIGGDGWHRNRRIKEDNLRKKIINPNLDKIWWEAVC
jgi:glycosyltransferase involved in cell wall biosynthesis